MKKVTVCIFNVCLKIIFTVVYSHNNTIKNQDQTSHGV